MIGLLVANRLNYYKLKLRETANKLLREQKEKSLLNSRLKAKATPAQIRYMQVLGIKWPKKCTKAQASNLIQWKLNNKE